MTLLKVRGIKKSFAEGEAHHQVLSSINLDVPKSIFMALCGPSGSGKSTLLNICGLLNNPDEGRLYWQDKEINFNNKKQLTLLRRNHVGFVFQTFNLVPVMTVFDNVEYPLMLQGVAKKERQERVYEMLFQVGLRGFENYLPDRLSGGQRQRVAIARALVKQPQLVIADEPTANLDSETAYQIIELMRELSKKLEASFLIATHDQRMTPYCHQIVNLQDGKLHNEPTSMQEAKNEVAAVCLS